MTKSAPRRRDGEERRRDLCNAAIQVLADHGSRGLTHQHVDRYAGVPAGTTSYYYRTRAALLHGVAKRVADIDTTNLESVTNKTNASDPPFARLAELVMLQSRGSGLKLNRARHEILLAATRDPALADASKAFASRIISMAEASIARLQPASPDRAILEAQTTAVTTFIAGVFTRLVTGDRGIGDAAQLERFLQAIVTAVALERSSPPSVLPASPQDQ